MTAAAIRIPMQLSAQLTRKRGITLTKIRHGANSSPRVGEELSSGQARDVIAKLASHLDRGRVAVNFKWVDVVARRAFPRVRRPLREFGPARVPRQPDEVDQA